MDGQVGTRQQESEAKTPLKVLLFEYPLYINAYIHIIVNC